MSVKFAAWIDRDVISVDGPWSGPFLQGKLTQDVLGLHEGSNGWSLLLSAEGTVDFFLRVTRVSNTSWVLDTDGGWGEALVDRLSAGGPKAGVQIQLRSWKALRVGFVGMVHLGQEPDVVMAWAHWFPWLPLGALDVLGPSPTVPMGFPLIEAEQFEYRGCGPRSLVWGPRSRTIRCRPRLGCSSGCGDRRAQSHSPGLSQARIHSL